MREEYAYCEPVSASSMSYWHIRKLGPKGLRPNGGADTKALCGRVVSWDLRVPLVQHNRTCPQCWAEYDKLMAEGKTRHA